MIETKAMLETFIGQRLYDENDFGERGTFVDYGVLDSGEQVLKYYLDNDLDVVDGPECAIVCDCRIMMDDHYPQDDDEVRSAAAIAAYKTFQNKHVAAEIATTSKAGPKRQERVRNGAVLQNKQVAENQTGPQRKLNVLENEEKAKSVAVVNEQIVGGGAEPLRKQRMRNGAVLTDSTKPQQKQRVQNDTMLQNGQVVEGASKSQRGQRIRNGIMLQGTHVAQEETKSPQTRLTRNGTTL
jgi:hypothetical protein